MEKVWRVAELVSTEFKSQFPELNPITLQLLWNRGLREQTAIDEFLNPDWGGDIHDPFLFTQMRKVVDRILAGIAAKEKIIVHGDYDADGVCSSAVLITTLRALGADVDVYLPHREREGYGLNLQTIDHLHDVHKANLIITCDCGTSNHDEVARATELGMDVIITDHHHEPAKRPAAFAIINPQLKDSGYPFPHLAGSGVAFKVAQALIRSSVGETVGGQTKEGFEKWLLDYVAISTVTDFMPLVGENRTLVKYGLVVLRKSPRPGIRALAEAMSSRQENFDTTTIGFQIGPRLNAAGRMDHASTAFRLLISTDAEEATAIAAALNQSNVDRQKLTETIVNQAKKSIGTVTPARKLLAAVGEGWPVGVVGLVAGKLADANHRPVLVMAKQGEEVVGSGRSIPGYDITDALLRHKQLLTRFGGHAGACGFTMPAENAPAFVKGMEEDAAKRLTEKDLQDVVRVDIDLALPDVTWSLLDTIELLEPYGEGNPKPTFSCRGMIVTELQPVGKEGKHLRIVVNHTVPEPRKFISFGGGEKYGKTITIGDKIDAVFTVDRNEWNGTAELQLKVVDLHIS
ncbi:MAG: single-stranded-DNA-specific exonuclease RecJ [bacterium]|nr:single-stranded-DNA-specific exonuclease RecJ [bacterium]